MPGQQDINFNGKRSNVISGLKRKNLKLAKDIQDYLIDAKITDLEREKAEKFRLQLNKCASFTMYKQLSSGEYEHISSHTCDHKACFVCNYLRQKKIRRRYLHWLKENPNLWGVIDSRGKLKVTTAAQAKKKYPEQEPIPYAYDVMHLMLSVPHTKQGFRGQIYYHDEIKKCFWLMRKYEFWQKMVYGGEFGIEITKGENGFHVHIHALLMVKKFQQNRNTLWREILLIWNKLTIDKNANRKEFTDEMTDAIKRGNATGRDGNKVLSEEDINSLSPMGSTIIHLENAYKRDDKGRKVYIKQIIPEDITPAILEIISYHFKPMALEHESNVFNLPLLVELLPLLHGLRIYDRFGCLYGEKALNLTNNDYLSDLAEAKQAQAEASGTELLPEGRGKFIITNPALVFHDVKDNYKIKFSHKAIEQAMVLGANSTSEALAQLGYLTKELKDKKVC